MRVNAEMGSGIGGRRCIRGAAPRNIKEGNFGKSPKHATGDTPSLRRSSASLGNARNGIRIRPRGRFDQRAFTSPMMDDSGRRYPRNSLLFAIGPRFQDGERLETFDSRFEKGNRYVIIEGTLARALSFLSLMLI